MGLKLFERGGFSLTPEGACYLERVCAGLTTLAQLPNSIRRDSRTRLTVAVTPTFCRQFVMPRLEQFRSAYPEIELTIHVSIPLADVTAGEADLEVRFGRGGYSDVEYRPLLNDHVTPVCSPGYLNRAGPFGSFETAEDMRSARFIRSPLEPWATWFDFCSIHMPEPDGGAQFNDIGLVYDAAASGLGVALLRPAMGAAWLDSGRLVRLSKRSTASPHGNYICWRKGMLSRWECSAFVDWLIDAVPR